LTKDNRKDVMIVTTVTLSKWGNSNGVRIPNQFIKRLNLTEGSELEAILTPENHILLRPIAVQETSEELRSHLKQLLSKVQTNSQRHDEIDLDIEGDELI